ncbi:MAG TPA: helix-turn-helix transcriptional regulator [Ilumatobacteraceae bacterium]|nr:helix-turn-helix transcriptional regulator [Ilumatobacteraceae bacterium]
MPMSDLKGVRTSPHRRSSRAPLFGWESLTENELRVTGLVAAGYTNRQAAEELFVSPHTIDFHLRQIFRKLGIGSRVLLATQAWEHRSS